MDYKEYRLETAPEEEIKYLEYKSSKPPKRGKRPEEITPKDRLHAIQEYYTPLISALRVVLEDRKKKREEEPTLFPGEEREDLEEMYSRLISIRDSWKGTEAIYLSPDTPEDTKREIEYLVEEWWENFQLLYTHRSETQKEGEVWDFTNPQLPPYRIVIDPKTGERTKSTDKTYLWGEKYFVPGEGILKILEDTSQSRPLEELRKLSNLPTPSSVRISKDLISSEFKTQGDILEIGSEEDKNRIRKLQEGGKLLFGSLEGLSGGTAYFKSFSIALAKILNEQSNYYNTETRGDRPGGHLLSGVPKEKIREVFGESAKLEGVRKAPIRTEQRESPYILLSYERIAKEMSKTGKISGGKDIDYIRLYLNGGYREFKTDPKTGVKTPVKSSYVPGLASKKYPVSDGKGHYLFLPFVVNEGEIVDTTRRDPEVGCLLRLSPQYSKTLRGYTSLRGDTIQLIGGARQKDITMDIIAFLVFSRGTSLVLKKRKSDLLSKYQESPTYRVSSTGGRRLSKLEGDFKEAIQKAKEAKILRGYREERNSGGEVISVFLYNPDYLKGEEILSEGETEETGEE